MENTDKVLMAHGSGGVMMQRIIQEIFLSAFGGGADGVLDDAAVLPIQADRIAMSTDTFVVTLREFPGGDIGDLAVCGTVNDVATSGATVQYLSCGFILEEGLELDELRRITVSMRARADEAGVRIVTGDTKVVEKGSGTASSSTRRASARSAPEWTSRARTSDRAIRSCSPARSATTASPS